ncbi:MAG: hypothetical protein AAF517_13035 [Planctomycetota bacterium]
MKSRKRYFLVTAWTTFGALGATLGFCWDSIQANFAYRSLQSYPELTEQYLNAEPESPAGRAVARFLSSRPRLAIPQLVDAVVRAGTCGDSGSGIVGRFLRIAQDPKFDVSRTLPILIRAVEESPASSRFWWPFVFLSLGKEFVMAEEYLASELENRECPMCQQYSAVALARIGEPASNRVSTIRSLLPSQEADTQTFFAYALWRLDGDTEVLVRILVSLQAATSSIASPKQILQLALRDAFRSDSQIPPHDLLSDPRTPPELLRLKDPGSPRGAVNSEAAIRDAVASVERLLRSSVDR